MIDNTFQHGLQFRGELPGRYRIFGNHRRQCRQIGIFMKGAAPRNHFIEHTAKGKDIGPPIHFLARRLFGRHIGHRAENLARLGKRLRQIGFGGGGGDLGDPEIQDLHQPALRHHNVARFQVAMHDAGGVRGRDGAGNLHRDRQHLTHRRPVLDNVAKRLAVHPLHGDEIDVRLVPHFVDRDNIRVVERARRLRFADQSPASRRALPPLRRKNLQRNQPVQPRIERQINRPHSAHTQFGLDVVVAQTSSGIHCLRDSWAVHGVLGIVPHRQRRLTTDSRTRRSESSRAGSCGDTCGRQVARPLRSVGKTRDWAVRPCRSANSTPSAARAE